MPKTKRTPKPARAFKQERFQPATPLAFKQERFQPAAPLADGTPSCLSENIRDLRREKCWTYPALERECGVSATMLKQIESGRRLPRLDALCAIARALGTTPSKLLDGVE